MIRHGVARLAAGSARRLAQLLQPSAAAAARVEVAAPANAGARGWAGLSRGFAASADDELKQKGKVKWFNTTKGWGFIAPADGTPDVFVHQSVIYAPGFRTLREGEDVEYFLEQNDEGKIRAMDVTGPGGDYVQGISGSPGGGPRDDFEDEFDD